MTIKEFEEENMKLNILIEMGGAEDIKVASNTEHNEYKDVVQSVITRHSIIQSARTIRDYCNGTLCNACIFFKGTVCQLTDKVPHDWKFEEEPK